MIADFHFLRPEWLWALAFLALLPFFVVNRRNEGNAWRAVCDKNLLKSLLIPAKIGRLILPVFLLGLGGTIAIIALAGPTWEKLPRPVLKQPENSIILADISLFMNVQDVSPSRMDRARFKISDLLKKTADGQNALILYDNIPFVAVPLTGDTNVIENILPTIKAGMMGGQVPDLAAAIAKAHDMLTQTGTTHGNVYLLGAFADNSVLGNALTEAKKLKDAGHRLSVIGIGTKQGGPLLLPDGSLLKIKGQSVVKGVTDTAFSDLATQGGGIYTPLTATDADIDAILERRQTGTPDFDTLIKNKTADDWKDEGAFLTWFLVPLAALCFRRGWLAGIAVTVMVSTSPAQAFSLRDLFVRPDRTAAERLTKGASDIDPTVFKTNDAWRGAAAYKTGAYPVAVDALTDVTDTETMYNYANALAQTGKYREAIDTYAAVLKQNPDHADAAFNKKYVEDRLKQNQQQQDQKDKKNQQNPQNQSDNKNDASPSSQQNNGDTPQQEQTQSSSQNNNGSEKNEDNASQDASERKQPQSDNGKDDEKNKNKSAAPTAAPSPEQQKKDAEKKRRDEWLDTIPDDPSGLLYERIRRKLIQKQRG